MNLLFIQKEGVDLYSTLLSSETSRGILRFYRPVRTQFGVIIENATLGNALSLASEISWYIRRYTSDVLLELSPDLFCTLDFALDIYKREIKMKETWDFTKLIGIRDGFVSAVLYIQPHSSKEDYPGFEESFDTVFEVWCCKDEWTENFSENTTGTESG
ncbi:hypothetical protein J2128_000924 [Methanomicrobium sp. W14]|uniref:DUF5804 family protein n=1 Tax=Methanomicrobium sp. W14 TaxID=2817839 RepID=UPI001AEA72D6|nr:DUF5804 family protein [Methanomicrobium sp. W14]MBP2133003.1 hypothetical protein [Methanomicrobium sp. W14]